MFIPSMSPRVVAFNSKIKDQTMIPPLLMAFAGLLGQDLVSNVSGGVNFDPPFVPILVSIFTHGLASSKGRTQWAHTSCQKTPL